MKVLFATPCYIQAATMPYCMSMFTVARELDVECSLITISDSLIPRARNLIATHFLLDTDFTHLFFIDSDIVFTTSDVKRLIAADRDIVAATYPKKAFYFHEGMPLTGKLEDYIKFSFTAPASKITSDGFVEVAEAPAGFMLIKRQVFEKMTEKDDLKYRADKPFESSPLYRFFECFVDPDTNKYLSEDYGFCRRWRDMGGEVYLDTQCNLGHLGQHLFRGDIQQAFGDRFSNK